MKNLTSHNSHNVKVVEALLDENLKKIFAKVDLHYNEWDLNIVAFEEVIKSPKIKRIKKLSEEYDQLFKIAESFGVRKKINPHFTWFKNLFNTLK